jgi:hypothetical protein
MRSSVLDVVVSTRERPRWGVRGQGAQRRSTGRRRVSGDGEGSREKERGDARTGDRRGVGYADHRGVIRRSAAEEKRGPVPPPLMLFSLLTSIRSFSGGSRSYFASASGVNGVTSTSVTKPESVGPEGRTGDSGTIYPWKVGVWLSPRFRTKWHLGDSLRAQRGEGGGTQWRQPLGAPTRPRGRGRFQPSQKRRTRRSRGLWVYGCVRLEIDAAKSCEQFEYTQVRRPRLIPPVGLAERKDLGAIRAKHRALWPEDGHCPVTADRLLPVP